MTELRSLDLPTFADQETRRVYETFVHNGRITRMPRRASRRFALLNVVALLFEPGVHYPEWRVNEILGAIHDDHAALRRYLVDQGLLDRANNTYWRCGGPVIT